MNPKSEISDFRVPLNSVKGGHLVFLSDVTGVTIHTDPSMSDLARASFEHILPRVRVEEETIMIKYRDFSSSNVRVHLRRQPRAITLNPSIPWEIEFRERVSNLHADLRRLELRSLDLLGGASQVELSLPNPIKTSFIYIPGGIEDSVIHAPIGVGMRMQVNGPVKHLFFDDRYLDAPGGKTSLENTHFQCAESRYDIFIADGTSHVTIGEQRTSFR